LTNGGLTIANTGGFSFISMNITPSETVSLREVSMLVGSWTDQFPSISFGQFDYEVRVWSSPQGPGSAPQTGDVLDCYFNFPSNVNSNDDLPPVFGSATSFFGDATPSFLLNFDLVGDANAPCAPVTLQAGTTYAIAVQPIRLFGATGMGIVDSLDVTPPVDLRFGPDFPFGRPLTEITSPFTSLRVNGRGAYRVMGASQ